LEALRVEADLGMWGRRREDLIGKKKGRRFEDFTRVVKGGAFH